VRRISPDHSRYLDAWRGVSAIAVLVAHAPQIFIPDASPAWGTLATGAVMVFFVISGFFIRKSLERGGDFLAARVNRIAPPFAFAIVLTIALWFLAPLVFLTGDRSFVQPTAQTGYSLEHLGPTMLLVNGFMGGTVPANLPLWSLSYELFYYGLAWLQRPRLALILLIAASALNPAIGLLGAIWFAGFWIAKLHSEERLPDWPQWPFLLPLIVTLPLMLMGRIYIAWQVSAGLAFAGHLLWVLKRVPPDAGRISRTADWSYTLYLIHFPLLLFAYGAGLPMLPSALAILLAAGLIGPRIEAIRLIGRRVAAPA
jgi:peptidoglycan/LPS O-acetylase OafA/YrhL